MPLDRDGQEHRRPQVELPLRPLHREDGQHHHIGLEPSQDTQEGGQRLSWLRAHRQLPHTAAQRHRL